MSSRANINKALRTILNKYDNVVLLGQSIRDPFGGAYKVTRGLTKTFNDRIIDTPISEAGMIGVASGLALRGYCPIVEIMFEDFLTLCVDQIASIARIINDHQKIKVLIRAMHNDDQAYGPSHCQDMAWLIQALPSTEYWYMLSEYDSNDVVSIYEKAIYNDKPVHIIREFKEFY